METALQRMRERADLPQIEWVNLLVQEAARLTDSAIGYFAVTDNALTQLTMLAWSKSAMAVCAMSEVPINYPVEATGLWGDCIRERRPVITNDYEACTRITKKGYPDGHVPVKRHMNVAVMSGDAIKGILGVGNKIAEYREQDAARLQAFANAAWPLFASIRERAAV
jgi:GAF domain-containing protein